MNRCTKGLGKFIIVFLDHNGMRPIIALVVIAGAILITINSDRVCVIRENPTQPPSTSSQTSPSPASTPQPLLISRDNPVCSKYFEIAALILGGLIGLAEPGIRKTQATPEESDSEGDTPP